MKKMRFFEWGRTWRREGDAVQEQKMLSGILFDKKTAIDFYQAKDLLRTIFSALGIHDATWQRCDNPQEPWFAPHQTADIMVGEQRIARVGMVSVLMLGRISAGTAFAFEINGDFLLQYTPQTPTFVAASKYPTIARDISMRVPRTITADTVISYIKKTNAKIVSVELLDFFEKAEWADERALTCRFIIEDQEKTLTKEEADVIWEAVATQLKNIGATIR